MRVRPELRVRRRDLQRHTARVLEPAMPTALSFARPASLAPVGRAGAQRPGAGRRGQLPYLSTTAR